MSIGMLKQFHNAIFFKLSFILPDRIVQIKTDLYAYIYPSEMAPIIKVKVINKVKGQIGTANQSKGPRWIN